MGALAAVTPQDVIWYSINLKTCGSLIPAPEANPISWRDATLGFDKKAISFFMPNQEKWSVTRAEGNATQSQHKVNPLFKCVKKKRHKSKV